MSAPFANQVGPPRSSHLRRQPAHLSVSLRHDTLAPNVDADQARIGSSEKAAKRSPRRQYSDESIDSVGGAEKWFNQSNKHPGPGLGFPQSKDSEPPFFLPHTSSDTSDDASGEETMSRPRLVEHRPQLQHSITNGSSIGDYRDVIDDLTIENQKLRQKVRNLSKARQKRHLEEDKLFEVKIHALPPRKRRELEDFLRSFASSVVDDSIDEKIPPSQVPHPYTSRNAPKSAFKHSSSSATSTSRPVDSAYASLTNSTSTFTPNRNHLGDKASQPGLENDQNIHTFLHNIPEGLLPKQSPVMTEKQKKKLVVQRLERLFTGKRDTHIGDHSQPLQQQEVSRSAQKADRDANNDTSSAEGIREAHMLPYASNEIPVEVDNSDALGDASTDEFSPNQRPTRPLDLDPDRIQVPSENADYIRHLGLSTPRFNSEPSSESAIAADASGWIYLNLLINMAQLHIINVTPDFVRAALEECSERFHVSKDGQQVKWRGGRQGTLFSSDSGVSTGSHQTPEDSDSLEQPNHKRRKVESNRFAPMPVNASMASEARKNPIQSFHYKPLFRHTHSYDSLVSSDESNYLFDHDGKNEKCRAPPVNHTTWTEAGNQGSTKEKQDAGLLVFYNNARFCTDLTGDRQGAPMSLQVPANDNDGYFNSHGGEYSRENAPLISRTTSGSLLPFRPFKDYSKGAPNLCPTETPGPETPMVLSEELDDNLFIHPTENGTTPQRQLQSFTSSGIGGTRPADHFTVNVETRRTVEPGYSHAKLSKQSTRGTGTRRFVTSIPSSALESSLRSGLEQDGKDSKRFTMLQAPEDRQSRAEFPVKTEIVSSQLEELEPSELPPPLGYYGDESSEDDSEGSSTSSEGSWSQRGIPFTSLPRGDRLLPWNSRVLVNSQLEEGDEEDEDHGGDESIDMLADLRRLDPVTIAAQEHEFKMAVEEQENRTDVATIDESRRESPITSVPGALGRYESTASIVGGDD